MLIDFTVENFRSYRDAKTLSLTASSAKELPDNLIKLTDTERLLRTAAIYGANASGKSNLLAAMYTLSELLRSPMAGPAGAQVSYCCRSGWTRRQRPNPRASMSDS